MHFRPAVAGLVVKPSNPADAHAVTQLRHRLRQLRNHLGDDEVRALRQSDMHVAVAFALHQGDAANNDDVRAVRAREARDRLAVIDRPGQEQQRDQGSHRAVTVHVGPPVCAVSTTRQPAAIRVCCSVERLERPVDTTSSYPTG